MFERVRKLVNTVSDWLGVADVVTVVALLVVAIAGTVYGAASCAVQ